jgi:hypothetical protein
VSEDAFERPVPGLRNIVVKVARIVLYGMRRDVRWVLNTIDGERWRVENQSGK